MTEVSYAEVQYMIRRKDGDAAWKMIAGGSRARLSSDEVS
jgi:hypothetical protein